MDVDGFRDASLAALPRWYSPLGHVTSTVGIGVAALLVALVMVRDARWYEYLAIPVIVVVSNMVEWWAHKNVLHKRLRGIWAELYEKHTPMHHRLYVWEKMSIRQWRELAFVLMPAVGVLGIVITASPMAILAGWLFGANVGWLTMMTQALYMVAYELTHMSYHLPAGHPVRRLSVIRRLAEHHALHHAPELMQKWNFNVTLPLTDWLFRTRVPADLADRIRRKRSSE